MSERYTIDDLEEMQVPDSVKKRLADAGKIPSASETDDASPKGAAPQPTKPAASAPKGKTAAKGSPYKKKGASKTSEKDKTDLGLLIGGGVLVGLLLLLMILWMSGVFGKGGAPTQGVSMATPDPDRSGFYNEGNVPDMSSEGVMGELKQAYYTIEGDLAVVLNLSNGTASEQQVVRINARVFNDKQETIAQQTIDEFNPKCYVPAMGRGEVYFVIDRSNVVVRTDTLEKLGVALEIASNPTDGGNNAPGQAVGDNPKDIAPGRSYYENLGNLPELSAEGVKATVIRAQYTNDGSLALTMSLSNGTEQKQLVSKIDVMIQNGNSGAVIANYAFSQFDTPCQVESKGFAQVNLVIDSSYVSEADDPLSSLATTISVSASPAA